MNKLCIVDLDGVVANSEARFAKAEEAKQKALQLLESDFATALTAKQKATDIYWRTAFTPELVALDTLIEGAIDAMATLAFNGYEVIILTSRPESMREASAGWLFEQGYPIEEPIIMKAPAFQYTKTTTWKAGMIQTLAALYGADDIVFIDDELANCQEVMKYQPIPLVFQSLAEAIEKL